MANVMSYWSLQSPALLRTANLQDALIVGRITGTQNQISRREPHIADALSQTHGAIIFTVGGFGRCVP